jgi:hypothetical protein
MTGAVECVVGAFPRSKTEMILGTISPYEGRVLAHLRTAVPSAEAEGEWVRTRKGVAVDIDEFPEILAGLQRLSGVAATTAVGSRIKKGSNLEIRVLLQPFQGDIYCHVRQYFVKDDKPGKGIAVKAHLLPELIDLATSMMDAIDNRCWEKGE